MTFSFRDLPSTSMGKLFGRPFFVCVGPTGANKWDNLRGDQNVGLELFNSVSATLHWSRVPC